MPVSEWSRRLLAGSAVAVAAGAVFAWYWVGRHGHPDFDQLYYAARSVRSGTSPYTAVGPKGEFFWSTGFYYPLPAVLLIVPLTAIGVRGAAALFVVLSGFALGVAIERTGDRSRYAMLLSRGFIASAALGQWSTLMLAAAWLPLFGVFGAAKPNVALVAAARWNRKRDFLIPVLASVVLVAMSFVVRPSWVSEWRGALGDAPYQRSPILWPGGFIALAALARWRRPEARCLLAYAIVPQTPGPYTDFMLFVVAAGWWENVTLSLLSYAPFAILGAMGPVTDYLELFSRYAAISNYVVMAPCVLMLLRRPNEGAPP